MFYVCRVASHNCSTVTLIVYESAMLACYFMRLVDVNVIHKERKERAVIANQKSQDIFQKVSVAAFIKVLQDRRQIGSIHE